MIFSLLMAMPGPLPAGLKLRSAWHWVDGALWYSATAEAADGRLWMISERTLDRALVKCIEIPEQEREGIKEMLAAGPA